MKKHHNQERTDVPEFGRTMVSVFKQVIQLHTLVAALRRSSGIVSFFPLRTVSGRAIIKTDIGFERDRTSSAILGSRARSITRTNIFGHFRADKFRVLPFQVVPVRLHLETGAANGNTIRSQGNAMKIMCLFCITRVNINERLNVLLFAKIINCHGIMSGI